MQTNINMFIVTYSLRWRKYMYIYIHMFVQVAWKPVPFLSVLQICVTNARAGFIAICSISYTFSVLFTDMQTLKFSSQICDKKNHQIFKTCISWGFRALFVKKLFKLFFRFRLVKLSGWGGGVGWGGGDDNVPWTCTHVWCYANWWLRDVNILWTCIHVDATQMCTHVWCYANVHTCLNYANWFLRVNLHTCLNYANWFLRDVNIPWTCTHVWTTQIGFFGMLTFLELAHMFDATQIGGFGMLTFFGRTSKIGCQFPVCAKVWESK